MLKFKQSNFMEKYVELVKEINLVSISFEKKLFKLMNNAVFGKTMENLRLSNCKIMYRPKEITEIDFLILLILSSINCNK